MEYDYEVFERCLKHLLHSMWRVPDCLKIGENISDVSEVKIIFDGYGYNEETDEQDNKNLESYAIFIHKDSLTEDFEFPEHDTTPWALIHRPKEEVCIFAWHDVTEDTWGMQMLEEIVENTTMKEDDVMRILLGLEEKYFAE